MCWNLGKLEYRIIDIIQLESFLLILKTATEKYIYILCKVSQKVILSLLENSNILHWSKNTETNLEISVSSNFGCAIKKKICLPAVRNIEARDHSMRKSFLENLSLVWAPWGHLLCRLTPYTHSTPVFSCSSVITDVLFTK